VTQGIRRKRKGVSSWLELSGQKSAVPNSWGGDARRSKKKREGRVKASNTLTIQEYNQGQEVELNDGRRMIFSGTTNSNGENVTGWGGQGLRSTKGRQPQRGSGFYLLPTGLCARAMLRGGGRKRKKTISKRKEKLHLKKLARQEVIRPSRVRGWKTRRIAKREFRHVGFVKLGAPGSILLNQNHNAY